MCDSLTKKTDIRDKHTILYGCARVCIACACVSILCVCLCVCAYARAGVWVVSVLQLVITN